ncbi:MAG: aminotransferase class I/II-fold pyridoxal phosphate-dependent enzyme, partial [Erysipelotrichaceae bacterium]|nr:aminotransferase class I/II-fold pyridoxal phosphate-dependent enzyme [Erysipelotrichaceae bacterium]
MEFSKEIGESLTLKFSELARKYKDEGKEIISMAVGEPNFHTPDYIKKATIDAINNNLTKYSSSRGLFPLRDAVVKDLNERFKTDYGASNVLITPGVKSSLHLALASVLLPQDEVIVLSPYYVSYPAIIKIAEPKSKITYIPSLENGRLDLGLISGAFNKNTKVIIVNSPSNPAGIVLNEEEIETIITLAKKYNTYILSDEIYDKLVFDGVEFNSFLGRGVKDLLIYTNGYSKSYAMTGFRIGYTVASSEVIEKMLKLQQNINTHTATFTQYGALSTYENEPTHLKPYLKDLQYRVNKL